MKHIFLKNLKPASSAELKDKIESFNYLTRAAKNESAEAQNKIGCLYD
ncbi:MAG: hypothetical protein LBE80_04015 [Deltaproteobacteria bacterium]|jgi:hypothetical protein|nr:hypothetical protein [Deltaproteobacteria bacterium]